MGHFYVLGSSFNNITDTYVWQSNQLQFCVANMASENVVQRMCDLLVSNEWLRGIGANLFWTKLSEWAIWFIVLYHVKFKYNSSILVYI